MEDIASNEDLITPERLAKGDLFVTVNLRGKINRAIPANLSIMKELIRRDVFPYHYEVYGVGFLELRHAFFSPLGTRSSAVLLEQWGKGISNGQGMDIFQTVCRKLGRARITVIEFVLTEPREKEVMAMHPVYKEAFETLIEIMDEEREKFRNSLKN